jgi:hypothetical protein
MEGMAHEEWRGDGCGNRKTAMFKVDKKLKKSYTQIRRSAGIWREQGAWRENRAAVENPLEYA